MNRVTELDNLIRKKLIEKILHQISSAKQDTGEQGKKVLSRVERELRLMLEGQ